VEVHRLDVADDAGHQEVLYLRARRGVAVVEGHRAGAPRPALRFDDVPALCGVGGHRLLGDGVAAQLHGANDVGVVVAVPGGDDDAVGLLLGDHAVEVRVRVRGRVRPLLARGLHGQAKAALVAVAQPDEHGAVGILLGNGLQVHAGTAAEADDRVSLLLCHVNSSTADIGSRHRVRFSAASASAALLVGHGGAWQNGAMSTSAQTPPVERPATSVRPNDRAAWAWLLLALVAVTPLVCLHSYNNPRLFAESKAFWVRTVGLAAAVAWLVARGDGGRWPRLLLPAGLYGAAAVLSVPGSASPIPSLHALGDLGVGICVFLLAWSLGRECAGRERIARAVALPIGIVAAYSLAQHLGWDLLDLKVHGAESSATFENRAVLGNYLMAALPFAVAAAVTGRRGRWGFAAVSVLGAVALVFTKTRGAWLGAGGAAAYVAVAVALRGTWSGVWKWAAGGVGAAAAGVALMMAVVPGGAGLSARLEAALRPDDPSALGRVAMWGVALDVARAGPWRGCGIGAYRVAREAFEGERITRTGRTEAQRRAIAAGGLSIHAHNDYLQVFAETGAIGAACFAVLAAWAGWRLVRTVGDAGAGAVSLAAGASLVALGVHALLHYPLQAPSTRLLFWIALGLVAGRQGVLPGTRGRAVPGGVVLGLAGCVLWADVCFAGYVLDHLSGKALRQGRRTAAERTARMAVRLRPFDARMYNNLAAVYQAGNADAAALEWFEKAIALRPYRAKYHRGRGVALVKLGRFREAIGAFDAAVRLRPRFAEAYEGRGVAKRALKRDKAAVGDLAQAVALSPRFVNAWFQLGVARLVTGDLREGRRALEETLRLDPAHVDARELLNRLSKPKTPPPERSP
jgi:O-antigen ligase/Flp pilus assembly protein TadD